jgi:sugar/nucleoside kinase (ribokinase family)
VSDGLPVPALVCVGDLVEDVVVWTHAPWAQATDNPATIVRTRGGSAANVAAFAAPLGPVRFIGRVGADPLGQALADDLAAAGVDVRVQRTGRTGSIVILVDETGERTMYPDRGASAELADVPLDWITGATVVHAPAYGLATSPSRESMLALLAGARTGGALISIDAASLNLLDDADVVRAIEQAAPDVVFANAIEVGRLALDRLGATVIVKSGPDPVRVIGPGGGSILVPVPPVDLVRDTIGAGDAFAAGYLSAVISGADAATAASLGIARATSVLRRAGAVSEPADDPESTRRSTVS